MAGYLYQCRLALLLGLRRAESRENEQISIEKFDDVAFDTDDHAHCLIQAKHHVAPKSMGNASPDIWKTLRTWIGEMRRTSFASSDLRFVLITTATASDGTAMAHLRPGREDEDVERARELLTVAAQGYSGQTTEPGRQAYLSLSEAEARLLLSRIDVLDKHPNLTNVREEIEGRLQVLAPDHVEQLVDDLEGWWFGAVAARLIEDRGATIPVQSIVRKAHDIGNKYRSEGLQTSAPETLGAPDYTAADESLLFVRQMRAVELADRAVRRGVRDFYRASAQRSEWAREALLLDGETEDYDRKLTDRFERHVDAKLDDGEPLSEGEKISFGREVCHWASRDTVEFRGVVETWITAGSFHGLADRRVLGWHPDHETLFPPSNAKDDDD